MEKNKIANDVKAVSTDVTTEDTRRKLNFSQLLSQVNAEYIEDLINLNVNFTIKNNKGKDGETYSNIKRISLVE